MEILQYRESSSLLGEDSPLWGRFFTGKFLMGEWIIFLGGSSVSQAPELQPQGNYWWFFNPHKHLSDSSQSNRCINLQYSSGFFSLTSKPHSVKPFTHQASSKRFVNRSSFSGVISMLETTWSLSQLCVLFRIVVLNVAFVALPLACAPVRERGSMYPLMNSPHHLTC